MKISQKIMQEINASREIIISKKRGVVSINSNSIGLLVPSTIFGISRSNKYSICGRGGIVEFDINSPESICAAFVQSDSICFGNQEEVNKYINLLSTPSTSRTFSYLISTGGHCRIILEKQEKINSSNILVIGCGGVGSMTVMNLAGSGIKNIHIVDGDIVEHSNLNRQFFWTKKDAGRYKCDVLIERLMERFDNLKIKKTTKNITSQENIINTADEFDIIVVTADEPLGISEKISKHFNGTLINAGYIHSNLYYKVSTNKTRVSTTLKQKHWERGPWFIGPSFGASNTELAGIISSLTLRLLIDVDHNKYCHELLWVSDEFPRRHILKDTCNAN